MADFTPEQMRRMHDFAEQLAELAEHHEDRWKVQTTDGQIFLTMMIPTAPHGLNVMRLRRPLGARHEQPEKLSRRLVIRAPSGSESADRPRERMRAAHRT
ncbi:hypothetical protein ACWGQT_12375, partial [Streptomyces yangpuensis]